MVKPCCPESAASKSTRAFISRAKSSSRGRQISRQGGRCFQRLISDLRGWPHNARHSPGEFLPLRLLRDELLLARRSEAVVLEFALQILAGWLPFGCNPAFALQPVESRVERAVLDLQQVFRGSLDVLGNLVAMSGPEEQGAEDQHVQRSLEELDAVGFVRHKDQQTFYPNRLLDGRRPTENLVSEAGLS